jgi:hypothetical protein
MAIERANLNNTTSALLNVPLGMGGWWSLRLWAKADPTPTGGAMATLKVNGSDIPTQNGGVYVQVDPNSADTKMTSADVLLEEGDVISIDVQGPSNVDISLSGEVAF